MKKNIFLTIAGIVIILVILFFASETAVLFIGVYFETILCGISPNCAITPQDSGPILAQAIASQDVKVCDKLPEKIGGFSGDRPRWDCYEDYNRINNNPDPCKTLNIGEDPYSCNMRVATLTKNPEFCEKISYDNENEKLRFYSILECYTAFALNLNDKSLCNNLNGEEKLFCLIPFSDSSICSQFSEEGRRIICIDWVSRYNR